ncbi:hypothetical protein NDU88_001700 [Pleurodeles waltl]|uniref:Heat shock factor protein 5 n=1 Tax=Pleurodeles waltl TaxID=8319 RepID=A0AAV7U7Y5_PLEWA|nr:hypothetical protein NDU88_001700 [Pleurodeles waltl]
MRNNGSIERRSRCPQHMSCHVINPTVNAMEIEDALLSTPINPNNFPAKLWRLVNSPRYQSIRWDSRGEGVIIDQQLFESELLCPSKPLDEATELFKTTNFTSFIRQLNLYGFRKVVLGVGSNPGQLHPGGDLGAGDGHLHHFHNVHFRKDHPDMLVNLKRLTSANKAKLAAGLEVNSRPPNRFQRLLTNSLDSMGKGDKHAVARLSCTVVRLSPAAGLTSLRQSVRHTLPMKEVSRLCGDVGPVTQSLGKAPLLLISMVRGIWNKKRAILGRHNDRGRPLGWRRPPDAAWPPSLIRDARGARIGLSASGGLAAYLTPTSQGLEWRRKPRRGRYGPEMQPDLVSPCTAGRSSEAPVRSGGGAERHSAPGAANEARSSRRRRHEAALSSDRS